MAAKPWRAPARPWHALVWAPGCFAFARSLAGPSPGPNTLGLLVWALSLSSRISSPPGRPRCAMPLLQLGWERGCWENLRCVELLETGQDLQDQGALGTPQPVPGLGRCAAGAGAVAEGLGEGAILSTGLRFFPDGIIHALVALFPSLRVLTLVSWPHSRLNDRFQHPLFPPAALARGRSWALFRRAPASAAWGRGTGS